ncbi:hypothetical protein FEM48_Zijuj07G0086000 [Ziziphus jujuba var. spinosa]|uniref:EF-hand domain-containing protein n=1 Tax=Ziziphus jujuba var. spinosa TaxID=714518 RepID=A0A978V3L3_ZIZJJ|nr:hypothetical protein FEM48_Zijuj07G0086000 [Ziziphus jujuba var. spinosa]
MLKSSFSRRYHGGTHKDGINLEIFIYFISNLYKQNDYVTLLAFLRQFGYNDDLQLLDFVVSSSIGELAPDHETHAELSNEAIKFFRWIFNWFDLDSSGALTLNEMIELFDMAQRSPFSESPYKHASLMPLLDPTFSMKNLSYIGYGGEPTSAICVTKKSGSTDCQLQQQPRRNVFQCFVFGLKKSEKSALLDSFLIRSLNHDDTYILTSDDRRYAVNDVDR